MSDADRLCRRRNSAWCSRVSSELLLNFDASLLQARPVMTSLAHILTSFLDDPLPGVQRVKFSGCAFLVVLAKRHPCCWGGIVQLSARTNRKKIRSGTFRSGSRSSSGAFQIPIALELLISGGEIATSHDWNEPVWGRGISVAVSLCFNTVHRLFNPSSSAAPRSLVSSSNGEAFAGAFARARPSRGGASILCEALAAGYRHQYTQTRGYGGPSCSAIRMSANNPRR